jgi:hypothetical protein
MKMGFLGTFHQGWQRRLSEQNVGYYSTAYEVLFQMTCSTCHLIHTCGQQTPPQVTYFSLVLETLEFFFSGELFAYKQNPFGFLLLTVMTVKEKNKIFSALTKSTRNCSA